MNTEYLLDAIGLIDDDLILDAERSATRPKVVPFRRKWTSWAACLAVVVVLGYGISNLPFMNAKSSDSAAAAPEASFPAASAPAEAPTAPAATSPLPSGDVESDRMSFRVSVTLEDGLTYAYKHSYPLDQEYGERIDVLPEGCQIVGSVMPANGDNTVPHTDIGVYEGCTLWLLGSGRDSTLYLELPEGGYLVCEYSQTYDFSHGGTG